MKRYLSIVFILMLVVSLSYAANRPQGQYRPTGYEAVTVDNTSGGVALTSAKYNSSGKIISDFALITVESAEIRYTVDGTSPTTTVGNPVLPYTSFILQSYDELVKFRAIRTGSTSASIKVIYYLWTP